MNRMTAKMRNRWRRRRMWMAVSVSVLLSACNSVATTERWARNAVGEPISSIASLAEMPGTFPNLQRGLRRELQLANGHRIYRYALRPACDVLFEADEDDIIRGFTTEGPDC